MGLSKSNQCSFLTNPCADKPATFPPSNPKAFCPSRVFPGSEGTQEESILPLASLSDGPGAPKLCSVELGFPTGTLGSHGTASQARSLQGWLRDTRGNRCSAVQDVRPGLVAVDVSPGSRPGGRSIVVELRGSHRASRNPCSSLRLVFWGRRPFCPYLAFVWVLGSRRRRGARPPNPRFSAFAPPPGGPGRGGWDARAPGSRFPPGRLGCWCGLGSSCESQVQTPPRRDPPRVRDARGSREGWLPGSAVKCGVDPIRAPIPAAVGTSGERGAAARRLQRTHGDRTGFPGRGRVS